MTTRNTIFILAVAFLAGAGCAASSTPGDGIAFNLDEECACGLPVSVPGRIEAESYDLGGEGVAYHDTTPGNTGGAFRDDDVDIQPSGGGHHVGFIEAGEWLAYQVFVEEAGLYRFSARVASADGGQKVLHIEVDGHDVTGPLAFWDTPGWFSYVDVSAEGVLTEGAHMLRVVMDTPGFNLDSIEVTRSLAPDADNIAFGRPVRVSSVEPGSDHVGERAVDGDPWTRWSSAYDDPQWIEVDLGGRHQLDEIVLRWEVAYGRDYQVEVSDDAAVWRVAHVVRGGDGETDHITFDEQARYVRVFGVARGTPWGYSLWELEIYGHALAPPATNLALGRPAHASSTESPWLSPSAAVDGDPWTRWSSDPSDPQWLEVDLGELAELSGVTLRWEIAYGRAYEIQVSADGAGWLTAHIEASGDGGLDQIDLPPTLARYVRVLGLERGTPWGYSLWELEVYGVPAGVAPLLVNGDFEAGTAGSPDAWGTGAWQSGAVFSWEVAAGRSMSRAVSITVDEAAPNDAWWEQELSLTPGGWYNFSGWIRGENIAGGGTGANLSIVGTYEHSWGQGSTGTFDWKHVAVTFQAPESGLVTVGPRLGFWGSTVSGQAWFDDLVVSGDDFATPRSADHLRLMLEREDADTLRASEMDRWVAHLDAAYEAYAELVGGVPFEGVPMSVVSVRQYPGGWAVAGDPIRWYRPYVVGELTRIGATDDWSFGILHEMSHVFDLENRWVFQAEMSANFKMVYVLETLGGRVHAQGTQYEGAAIEDFYRARYDEAISGGTYHWNAATHRLLQVKNTIGWAAFRETHRDFSALDPRDVPATTLDRFELYLDRLSANSGHGVRGLIPSAELDWMRTQLR